MRHTGRNFFCGAQPGLLINSFLRIESADLGCDPRCLLTRYIRGFL